MVAKLNCNLLENIHGWTVASLVWPKPIIAQAISLEKFYGHRLIHKIANFSTANDLQYTIYVWAILSGITMQHDIVFNHIHGHLV